MRDEYNYSLKEFKSIELLASSSSIDVVAEDRSDVSVIFEREHGWRKARYSSGIVGDRLSIAAENVGVEVAYPENMEVDILEILCSGSSIDLDGPLNVLQKFLFKAGRCSINIYDIAVKGGSIEISNKTSSIDIELKLSENIETMDMLFDKSSVDLDLVLPKDVSLDVKSDIRYSSIDVVGDYTVPSPSSVIKFNLTGRMCSLDLRIRRI